MNPLSRIGRNLLPAVKSWWHGAAPLVPTSEGLIPANWPLNYWQCGLTPAKGGTHPAVEACVKAIAETVGMMPCNHWRTRADGGRDLVTTSAASRVMRRPNIYQTRAQFIAGLLRGELYRGDGYAVVARNDRHEIYALYPMPTDAMRPFVSPDGSVYYGVNPLNDLSAGITTLADEVNRWAFIVPARDVLRIASATDPDDPLRGLTPLSAAALSVGAGAAILGHEQAFFTNMARPSGVLESDQQLTPKQMDELRTKWEAFTTGEDSGGTPILGWGLKWKPATMTSQDSQLVEAYRMTVADIARVFRVPLPVIGELGDATLANVQSLGEFWLATSLSYVLENVELALDYLFGLPPGEYMEFDVQALLRTDIAKQIEPLCKGIAGGLLSPNEARARLNLGAVPDGELPRMQSQYRPLNEAPAGVVPAAQSQRDFSALEKDVRALLDKISKGEPSN